MILEKQKYNYHSLIVCLFICVLFGLDIINKFNFSEERSWLTFIKGSKTIFYVFFIGVILFYTKSYYLKIGLATLLGFFISGQILLLNKDIISHLEISASFRILALLFFPLIFSSYIYILPKKPPKIFYTIFYSILILLIATIFIGLFWEIKFFKTYVSRFGYLGLMPKSITASYFFISALSLLYYINVVKNNKKICWLFIVTLITSLLVGTKSIYLFVFLLFAFHFIKYKFYKKKIIYITLLSAVLFFLFFNEFLYDQGKIYFKALFDLYETKGLLTSLTSMRDEIFIDNINNYKEVWEWYNYLIGGKVPSFKLYENSVFDLYSCFGILGTGIYLSVFYKNMIMMMSNRNSFVIFYLISVFIISILAGQFFLNISAISYFILSFYLITTYHEKKQQRKTSMDFL